MKFYFTFPNKYPKLRGRYVELDEMPDEQMARDRIFSSIIVNRFAFSYSEEAFEGQAAKWGLSRIAITTISKSHFVTKEEDSDEHS